MSTITIRLAHYPTRTPIAEIHDVDPCATLASLRTLTEQRLAAERTCMMRVFARWHAEVMFGGRKIVVELTAQDEDSSLESLGIEDYNEVLLEGPLTGDFEGVGQVVALMGTQMRRLEEQNADLKDILLAIVEGITRMSGDMSALVSAQQRNDLKTNLPDFEYLERLALAAEEKCSFKLLSPQKAAVAWCLTVSKEEAKARGELLAAARSEFQRLTFCFAMDTTNPQPGVRFEGPYTAVKATDGCVTLRASQLTAVHHRWALRINEVGRYMDIRLGLLPKLPADRAAKMGGFPIEQLGGWCIHQGSNGSYVNGDWQCEKFPFGKGDLVFFDYSFGKKTLTIRCNGKQVVGRMPNAGEELYPAFTLLYAGAKVSFEEYIQ